MENKDIYEMIDRFESSSLTALEIERNGERVVMKKGSGEREPAIEPNNISKNSEIKCQPKEEKASSNFREVKAPLVGLFYTTPSPDSEPYVKVGDRVSKGQVLCLIEAMKMMNELKSPVDGVVRSILPEHGTAVEFDEVLFEVEEC